eukprot:COSAG04_NODE_370_length_15729_cov_5.743506_3_plen_1292_part_00
MSDDEAMEVDEMLEWLQHALGSPLHLKLGVRRELTPSGKETKRPTRGEKYNEYIFGPDDPEQPEKKGLASQPDKWVQVPKKEKYFAVFPRLHPAQNYVILDGDFGEGKEFTTREALRAGLPPVWFEKLPYTVSKKGFHFHVFVDGLPKGQPVTAFKNFTPELGEIYGGSGKVNTWVYEQKGRELYNFDEEVGIPTLPFDEVLKPFVKPEFYTPPKPKPKRSVSPSLARLPSAPRQQALDSSVVISPCDFDTSMLETEVDRTLAKLVFLVPNVGSDYQTFLMVGQVLHAECGGDHESFHLPLWICWTEGGPEDEAEREELGLPPGPPEPWGECQIIPCIEKWRSFRLDGALLKTPTLRHHLKTYHPAIYDDFKCKTVRTLGNEMYESDSGIKFTTEKSLMLFTDRHIAEITLDAMPPIAVQNKYEASGAKYERAIYCLKDDKDKCVTGRWSIISDATLRGYIGDDVRRALAEGKTHYFKKHKEAEDDSEEKDKYRNLCMMFTKAENKCSSAASKKGVMEELVELRSVCDDHTNEKFDRAQSMMVRGFEFCYFPFLNGLLNLNTGEFRPARPDEYLFHNCGCNYTDADRTRARNEVFKVLLSINGGMMPDGETVIMPMEQRMRFLLFKLLVWSGALRPDNILSSIYFLLGPGGNAKGTEISLLKGAFGTGEPPNRLFEQLASAMIERRGKGQANAATPDLMALLQARLVAISEPDADATLDLSNLKKWVTGDSVTGRELYKGTRTFTPMFTLFVECNAVPPSSETDLGWRRRYREISYGNSFGEYSPESRTVEVTEEMCFELTGLTKLQIREKVKSEEFRDAFADIVFAAYRLLFLPFVKGDLAGKMNLPEDYERADDQDAMKAWAPEWYNATKLTLGSKNRFKSWWHRKYFVTTPAGVEVYRDGSGGVENTFLDTVPPAKKSKMAKTNGAHAGKQYFYDREGEAENHRMDDDAPDNWKLSQYAKQARSLLDLFEKEEKGAADFDRCNNLEDKVRHVLRLIPKIGVAREGGGNKWQFWGYRKRKASDPAPEVEDDKIVAEGNVTEQYNATTTITDPADFCECWRAALCDLKPLPPRYGGPGSEITEAAEFEPEPEPSLESVSSAASEEAAGVGLIAEAKQQQQQRVEKLTSHTITDLHPDSVIADSEWETYTSPDDLELWDPQKVFFFKVDGIRYVGLMTPPTERQRKGIRLCLKRQAEGKGLSPAGDKHRPTLTVDEFLAEADENHKVRVRGLADPSSSLEAVEHWDELERYGTLSYLDLFDRVDLNAVPQSAWEAVPEQHKNALSGSEVGQ